MDQNIYALMGYNLHQGHRVILLRVCHQPFRTVQNKLDDHHLHEVFAGQTDQLLDTIEHLRFYVPSICPLLHYIIRKLLKTIRR